MDHHQNHWTGSNPLVSFEIRTLLHMTNYRHSTKILKPAKPCIWLQAVTAPTLRRNRRPSPRTENPTSPTMEVQHNVIRWFWGSVQWTLRLKYTLHLFLACLVRILHSKVTGPSFQSTGFVRCFKCMLSNLKQTRLKLQNFPYWTFQFEKKRVHSAMILVYIWRISHQ